MQIKEVHATQIKDSRGNLTIEFTVNGCSASSPSGKSTGEFETPQYHKSLEWTIKAIRHFAELKDVKINSFADLHIIEDLIRQKFNLTDAKQFGANALYALESAILKALAKHNKKQLWQVINPNARKMPIPVGNAIGGGMHSEKFKRHPTFQEFLLIPKEKSIKNNVKIMNQAYKQIQRITKARQKNDEGAWQVSLNDEQILSLLDKFKNLRIGIDAASSSFFKNKSYVYPDAKLTQKGQIFYMNKLIKRHNIFYLEDPLEENDFRGFSQIKKKNLVVGDDLTATHIDRLNKAIKSKSINAMIIKPNQNGSLAELNEIFKICRHHDIKTILSHRSGETMDDALADYAFGFGADFIKCGISTPWREVKLKRLIEIEKLLH